MRLKNMEHPKYWIDVVIITLVLLNGLGWGHGCLDQEREALLQLKPFFKYLSWQTNKEATSSDCCQWEMVGCNITTGRIIKLSLSGLTSTVLNISQFLPFGELKILDLSSNSIVGFVENQGFEILSLNQLIYMAGIGSQWPLRNLEKLDLSFNNFDNSILSSLSGFSSLKDLTLRGNQLSGTIDMQDLHNLTSLKKLDLSDNKIKDFRSFKTAHEGLLRLSALNVLDLTDNLFNSSAFASLNEFSQLKSLNLSGNQLTGSVNFKEFEALRNLEELEIFYNALEPVVDTDDIITWKINKSLELENIGYLTSLKVLHLSTCGIKGTLPPLGLCELQNLKELDLSLNELTGTLPPCFANLTSIRTLDLSYNHFQVTLELFTNHSSLKYFKADGNELIEENASQPWTPKFQLEVLSLSNTKNSRPKFPSFLYHQFNLRSLDLSGEKFGGAFPNWLFENNTRLEEIHLINNLFVGSFQWPLHPSLNLSSLDISLNELSGQIPSNISLIFPNLESFILSGNAFQGNIPLSLGKMNSLKFLDLSYNQFSGEIQVQFANMTRLKYIKLSSNNFSGEIPNLSSLDDLPILGISRNSLSGKLPRWIANMSSLNALDISDNHFEGPIPPEFCQLSSLQLLDLSGNNLSGFIPSCFSEIRPLTIVHMRRNMLTGTIPPSFVNISSLFSLNLGENNLNGPIPNWLGNLSNLGFLLLQRNDFYGDFPIPLCHLNQLRILDLSSNDLYGHLPPCLSNLSSNITGKKSYRSPVGLMISHAIISGMHEVIEFTTKNNSLDYTGYILEHMYGIDLSCNQFSGEIPLKFGNFVKALNFSHNNLSGSIPLSFSNLRQLESLDLSFNKLNGRIPSQLTQINTLEVFSVAHNNLSGPIPNKAQFWTFDESSYQGNPLLCGPPLNNSCNETPPPEGETKDDGFMDMTIFWVTIGVTYVVTLFSTALVLYINSYWRHAWFYLIDACFNTCYHFVLDNFQ